MVRVVGAFPSGEPLVRRLAWMQLQPFQAKLWWGLFAGRHSRQAGQRRGAGRRRISSGQSYPRKSTYVHHAKHVARNWEISLDGAGAEDGIRTRDPFLGKELGLSAVFASSRSEAKDAQLPSGDTTDVSPDNWTRFARGLPQGTTALRAKYLLSSGSCVRITPGAPEAGPSGLGRTIRSVYILKIGEIKEQQEKYG